MNKKIKLSVLGFSFNQTRTGTYGLVLAEENGPRRLMLVVGTPEAQSIAFQLQGTVPPRPLTHDLFKETLETFSIDLLEVHIHQFSDGVFYSKLIMKANNQIVELDSRTSDAVSLALRTKSPIYTYDYIMQELGVVFNESESSDLNDESNQDDLDLSIDYSLLNREELATMLEDAIDGEDYELASILRDELDKKKKD